MVKKEGHIEERGSRQSQKQREREREREKGYKGKANGKVNGGVFTSLGQDRNRCQVKIEMNQQQISIGFWLAGRNSNGRGVKG